MRDRYRRFTIVVDVLTIVTIVGAGLLFWGSVENSSDWYAKAALATSDSEKVMYWQLASDSNARATNAITAGLFAVGFRVSRLSEMAMAFGGKALGRDQRSDRRHQEKGPKV
jgi:hypothetical protein